MSSPRRRFTVVSFHAHPDDEALLTAGSLARAAAEGHRVVLVVATAGEQGLAASDTDLGGRRIAELHESAAAIGCARVVLLGYGDSGLEVAWGPAAFARVDRDAAARRLAEVLVEECADVLTVYDPAGGYGHPDHVQVHHVGLLAAAYARTPIVLEATIDRRPLRRVASVLRRLRWLLPGLDIPDFRSAYAEPGRLTHRIDVRDHLVAKRAALTAHASQATSDSGVRTLALLLRLPAPVFRRALGHEWYVEHGRPPGAHWETDLFASLREVTPPADQAGPGRCRP